MTEYIAPLGTVVIICTTHLTLKKDLHFTHIVRLRASYDSQNIRNYYSLI